MLRLIHERLAELARTGYRYQEPSAATRADERLARDMRCPECFHRDLHFIALSHPVLPGHVSLAWCDLCRVAMDVPEHAAAARPAIRPDALARSAL